MAYNKKIWASGDIIDAESLNNIENGVESKVDKETGKSLILDSEIERLASLTNYNDSELRALITAVSNKLNALADSDDTTLDQLSEIVAYIKSNKDLIDAIHVPTKVSDLSNDAGYLTEHQDISGKANVGDVYTKQEIDNKISELNLLLTDVESQLVDI